MPSNEKGEKNERDSMSKGCSGIIGVSGGIGLERFHKEFEP